jgi:hypothetical protein
MINKPAAAAGLETLCEAKTRVVTPLGGFEMCGPALQETKLKLASAIGKRADLFKRHAPNCRKTGDLSAK